MGNSSLYRHGYYRKSFLLNDLKESALVRKGKNITISFNVRAKETRYERRTSWLRSYWAELSSVQQEDYSLYQKDKLILEQKGYRGITYQEESIPLYTHTHNPSRSVYKRYEGTGYKVTVSVDAPTSRAIYEETLSAANSFKDYLLKQRPDILQAISDKEEIVRYPHFMSNSYRYCIHMYGIYRYPSCVPQIEESDPENNYRRPSLRFSDLGLQPLNGIEECYGLGLALLEYVQMKNPSLFRDYYATENSVSPCGGEYCIEVRLEKKKPALQTW